LWFSRKRRRTCHSARQADPRHHRQLRHAQAPQGPCLAGAPPALGFHFTSTSAFWINVVEGFLSTLTRQRLRRGVFHSVADLEQAIARTIREHNAGSRPFVWTKPADTILGKLNRLPAPSV
jgi:hypothetical protein